MRAPCKPKRQPIAQIGWRQTDEESRGECERAAALSHFNRAWRRVCRGAAQFWIEEPGRQLET